MSLKIMKEINLAGIRFRHQQMVHSVFFSLKINDTFVSDL